MNKRQMKRRARAEQLIAALSDEDRMYLAHIERRCDSRTCAACAFERERALLGELEQLGARLLRVDRGRFDEVLAMIRAQLGPRSAP